MKYLLLITALSAPATALAQQSQALQWPINPHGFLLAHPALLYRHLDDTLSGRYAHRLRPNDDVIVERDHPRWLKVVRGDGTGTNFSKDTANYYLPVQALKDARMFLLI